jgi:hypothetical protein
MIGSGKTNRDGAICEKFSGVLDNMLVFSVECESILDVASFLRDRLDGLETSVTRWFAYRTRVAVVCAFGVPRFSTGAFTIPLWRHFYTSKVCSRWRLRAVCRIRRNITDSLEQAFVRRGNKLCAKRITWRPTELFLRQGGRAVPSQGCVCITVVCFKLELSCCLLTRSVGLRAMHARPKRVLVGVVLSLAPTLSSFLGMADARYTACA